MRTLINDKMKIDGREIETSLKNELTVSANENFNILLCKIRTQSLLLFLLLRVLDAIQADLRLPKKNN